LFVGDGVLQESLRAQIERAGLSDYFQFTGLVEPSQIPGLLAAMDIVMHTSLREGLARVLPQALIAGKPVISYDIDGAREVVINDVTGVLLPPRDVAGLATALGRLAEDKQLRQQLGEQGRVRFTEQFRHEQMTAQLRTLYEQLLRGKSR
jgi:glycosyltransferase involved in cell wall biosynthesis